MFEATLPAMPRLLTALAEWLGCITVLMLMEKRWSPKITALIHLLFGTVIVLSQYCAYEAGTNEVFSQRTGFYVWAVGMAACMLIMLLYIMLCSRCSFSTAVGCWAVAFVTAELMASVEWQVSSALLASRSMKNAGVILVMLCVFGAMLLGVYVGEKKIYDGPVRMERMQSMLLWILALLAMVISNVGFQKMVWEDQADLRTTLSSIRSLVDFGALASMYLIQRVYWEHAMQMEMASVNYMLNLQYQQYRDYKMNSEYISRQCHDLKYQIDALRRACTEDEREQYLSEMETAIRNYNAQNVTGNPVLDTILTQKKILCCQSGIQFSCMADARELRQISVRDISIIFGNLIDNAMECVLQYEDAEDRMIQGEVYQKQGFLMIKFRNCFYGSLQFERGLPVTTKTDKARHGYGLKSVRYTVEKYHGTMKVSTEEGWFSVKILLPIEAS